VSNSGGDISPARPSNEDEFESSSQQDETFPISSNSNSVSDSLKDRIVSKGQEYLEQASPDPPSQMFPPPEAVEVVIPNNVKPIAAPEEMDPSPNTQESVPVRMLESAPVEVTQDLPQSEIRLENPPPPQPTAIPAINPVQPVKVLPRFRF